MKRSLIIIAALMFAIVSGSMLYMGFSDRQTKHVDALKIIAATRAYSADLHARGLPIPAVVSLQELTNRQLLTASDVSGFTGMEVTVNLNADISRPQEILIRARLSDGQTMVALADGSVHQLSSNRYSK